ncbi:GNAT family N-acetyltransferase [Devosia rhodophyticola]|uniref:GNAT family N-acetyltransferase n=1 Tax=Devosia rhodophyticola TaxID=3026423 RepID=A0ABY7Z1S3_9HYPH|nr:GNAT family N-acetyltransferase [Devosia rhodophyticola]WDR07165.1 GNAT family N-acetyltransferase [Devosia rhodophyticola]
MTTLTPHWRCLTSTDLDALCAIADIVHPDFFEQPTVLAERAALYPEGARLLELNGVASGYVLSHPWRFGQLPELNCLLGTIPADADTFYIHDLAVLPPARGSGAAPAIVADLVEHAKAKGFASMSLTAVNGSIGFWQRQGFVQESLRRLADKLESYEPEACYMVRGLG